MFLFKSGQFKCCFVTLICLVNMYCSAQKHKIEALGTQYYISPYQDSIYFKDINNDFRLELLNTSDSIEYYIDKLNHRPIVSPFPYIRYTNLDAGSYVLYFKEKSAKQYRSIKIEIEKPFYKKWWFSLVIFMNILLVTALAIYLFSLYNFRQKLKVEALRNKISQDLHDEVGSNLSSIAIFSELLKKKMSTENKEIELILDKIKSNSKESVNLMQDTVWAINPSNDSLDKLIARILSYARDILTSKEILFIDNYKKLQIKSDFNLDLEIRKNVYLILKEAINNIAKHAEATEASMEFSLERNILYITLQDNGRGFDPSIESLGNGLKNFKERADLEKIDCVLESQPGQGTKILLKISP
jgi:signal transduction histidine kinase